QAFMARANRICAETQAKSYAVPEPSNPESLEEESAYLTQVLAIQEERLKRLQKLTPAGEDAAKLKALSAEIARGVNSIRVAARAAADGDRAAFEASGEKIREAVAARSELARRARLMECVNIFSGRVVLEAGPRDSTLASEEPFTLGNYRSLFSNLREREVSEAELAVLSDNGFVAGFVRRWTTANGAASFLVEALEFKTAAAARNTRTALERLLPPDGVPVRDRKTLQGPGITGASRLTYGAQAPSGASSVDEIFFVRGSRLFRVSAISTSGQPSDEVRNLAKRQESLAVRGVP
ncbi:MAG: hypothetical protein ACRDJK_09420, partial [Actinomycetota bacterium]